MQSKNLLFLGFGDVARRTAELLTDCRRVGVARSLRPQLDGVEFCQSAADGPESLDLLAKQTFDAVVLTLTPAEHSAEAYARTYVETLCHLIPVWQVHPPRLIVFVSSTSVYHQQNGEWVDEASEALSDHFSGQTLLEAESLLVGSGLPVCIVRFGGIYGPGRDFLLRQVRAGNGGSGHFTNRIHVQDCAGVLVHLLRRSFNGKSLAPIYLACDSAPAPGTEVRSWLAERLGLDSSALQPDESDRPRGGNKRCSNRLLLSTGYEFLYPSYKDGYGALLDSGELPSPAGGAS